MYNLVRMIIGGIIFACSMIAVKKSKVPNKRALRLVFTILSVVLTGLLGFFPFENLFVTFDSPKTAYNYYHTSEKSIIDIIVEGDACDFVVGGEKGTVTQTYLIIPKTEDGWKVGIVNYTKRIARKDYDKNILRVFQHKNTNDYFVIIFNAKGEKMTITDEYNTQFFPLEKIIDSDGQTFVTYYGHITDFNSQYSVGIREPNRYGFKMPSFRRYCVKKPRKATALLRFFPCTDKNMAF